MDKDEYLRKVGVANEWMRAYYEGDAPLASDEEYDAIIRELRDFERENPTLLSAHSPTQKVAPSVQSEFRKIAHGEKMWSMEDVFSEAELRAWAVRAKCEGGFFIEPKFDGVSLNLTYENGVLISGATRGDGEIGEDVTQNVFAIDSIPKRINYDERIEIRGEVVILKADFDALNEKRAQSGQNLFANPRNAASGSLRQLDTSITGERNLKFYPWGVGAHNLPFKRHSEIMDFVRKMGFLKDEFVRVCGDLEAVLRAYSELLAMRDEKAMMMDGMVVRIDDLSQCRALGHTIKFPRFMAAFKFPALEKTTRLRAINLQVGRSGVITPVAEFDKVEIEGVKVRFASLHNFDEIARLGAKIGDFVSVIRSGDVIPKITKVYENRRTGGEQSIPRPTNCPVCGSEVLDIGTMIKCQNLDCKARMVSAITHFVSKKCLNIDGLGESVVEILFRQGKIMHPRDIFSLQDGDFSDLEGFKQKRVNNLLNAIKNARKTRLHRFINALGIEHIGEVAAKKIATHFGAQWAEKSEADFLALDGFGVEMAKSVAEFVRVNAEKIAEFYEILEFEDLSAEVAEKNTGDLAKNTGDSMRGKIFVITGTLSRPRDEFVAIIENLGGKTTTSISSKTHFLLYGENVGSKLAKAQTLGVECISEDEFWKMIS